ncbi:hypothetical protein CDR68_05085 [Salmonella enterica]|uniref:Uncharacterized protein n=2 Tax=Salmonella enterica TaxID=28901 RepID=A0A753E0F2_SALER|nr:hypothetical protein [Salmonella enterica]HAE8100922.1 hypothetical protein [Salmonella enterica subsp. indica serovar 45:a:e,n,x]HAF7944683.1 hypothetical protein [Salmonella enterica subsp. indica]
MSDVRHRSAVKIEQEIMKKAAQHLPVKWFSAVVWGVQINSTNQGHMLAAAGKDFKSAVFSLSVSYYCRAISLYSTIF